jgi:hypothetical protein
MSRYRPFSRDSMRNFVGASPLSLRERVRVREYVSS